MADTNLAVTLYGVNDLRMVDTPIPEPGPGEVQLGSCSVGICGSDVSLWEHGHLGGHHVTGPLILGHEPSAVVTKLGVGVASLQVGDRVAVEPAMPCQTCRFCRGGHQNVCTSLRYMATPPTHGALSRYFCHPAGLVHKLPDNVSFDEGALVQPFSIGFYACQRAEVSIGDIVLVTGAGPVGMCVVLAARARGAFKICVTDVQSDRLDFIKKIGADVTVLTNNDEDPTVTSQKVLEATGREVDVSVECSGSGSGSRVCVHSTRPKGVVCQVGLGSGLVELPLVEVAFKELDIRGMIRFLNTYPTVIEMISTGRVDVQQLVSHRFPLEQALEAYEVARRRLGVKVIIDCQRK